jgi:DNA-binding transcriptional ArsR family regulator
VVTPATGGGLLAAAPAFAALGDAVRLGIVARLCREGPLPTVALKQGAGVTRQGVTKHLQVLEEAGLVVSDRVGRDRQWRLEEDRLAEVRIVLDAMSAEWDHRIKRLRPLVE